MEHDKPLYLQIADHLRSDIRSGVLTSGTCLGSHQSLAEKYKVSLITVRKALKLLAEEGLVVLQQGKGTFVSQMVLQDDTNCLTGFSTILEKQSIPAQVEVRDFRFISPPSHLPPQVITGLGEKCLYIERLHIGMDTVLSYAKIYLPERFGRCFSTDDVMTHTIYQIYESKLHVALGKGLQSIYAQKAGKHLAQVMLCNPNDALLSAKRESYAREGFLIEYMETCYAAQHYTFKVEMNLSAQ